MTIKKDMKMADVIHLNYLLLSVINRFNINLGFGDRTVEQVCNDNKVNTDFFLETVNAFHDKNYIPTHNLNKFSLENIIDYLRKTHKYYLEEKVPEIASLIDKLISECSSQPQNVTLIKNFFTEYKNELENHIKAEEEVVYPYALKIKKAIDQKKIKLEFYNSVKSYSVRDYVNEHDNVEEKLYDLKNIIIKYLPPVKGNLCNKILAELFKLEADLNNHSRIEEKIMSPKVADLEKLLEFEMKNDLIELI